MRFIEFLLEEELVKPNSFDEKGKEMKLPNVYDEKDVGSKSKLSAQTVVVRNSKNGKVYGRRTIIQKEV